VSVDESLIMSKGCLSWKVYIPSRHTRFDIKSFELHEACEVCATVVAAMFMVV
jgi:hypothetical protein